MNQTFLDAFTAAAGELERVVLPPTGDLGYGRDLSCTTELLPGLAEVDPMSPRAIAEAAVRRLITPRGALPDDANYGLDLRSFANRGVPYQELRDLSGMVRNELVKDDRIDDVTVEVTLLAPSSLRINVRFVPADPTLTPFPLVFSVGADGAITVEALA